MEHLSKEMFEELEKKIKEVAELFGKDEDEIRKELFPIIDDKMKKEKL